MSGSLFDQSGVRKYLVARERKAFVKTALRHDDAVASFCLTLAITGARISEVLALSAERVDLTNGAVIFETLKQRKRGVFRAVPVPHQLLQHLTKHNRPPKQILWPWCRTTAWSVVKQMMREANIAEGLCKPKALRHGFAIEAGQQGVPLNIVQRWMGHARIETTAIYSGALGDEERYLASKVWKSLEIADAKDRSSYSLSSK